MKKSPKEIKKIELKHAISKEIGELFYKLEKEHGKDAVAEALCFHLATNALATRGKPDQHIVKFIGLLKKEYEVTVYHFKKVFGGLRSKSTQVSK